MGVDPSNNFNCCACLCHGRRDDSTRKKFTISSRSSPLSPPPTTVLNRLRWDGNRVRILVIFHRRIACLPYRLGLVKDCRSVGRRLCFCVKELSLTMKFPTVSNRIFGGRKWEKLPVKLATCYRLRLLLFEQNRWTLCNYSLFSIQNLSRNVRSLNLFEKYGINHRKVLEVLHAP